MCIHISNINTLNDIHYLVCLMFLVLIKGKWIERVKYIKSNDSCHEIFHNETEKENKNILEDFQSAENLVVI